MANFAAASVAPLFDAQLAASHPDLQELLAKWKADRAQIFAHLSGAEPGSDAARDDFLALLVDAKVDDAHFEIFTADCLRLHAVAKGLSSSIATRVANLSGFQISAPTAE